MVHGKRSPANHYIRSPTTTTATRQHTSTATPFLPTHRTFVNPKISSQKKPLKKLQAQSGMSSKAKVGSWLEHNDKSQAEAYESASENDDLDDGRINGKHPIDVDEEDEDDAEIAGEVIGRREDDISWEELGQSMRLSLSDPSKKRRRAFISRYLYVSEQCK